MTTKEQLFADLEKDIISNDDDQITKAKNEDDDYAMTSIGREYLRNKKYDKAMAWYRLALDKNNPDAQLSMGNLYYFGKGVPKDYLLALEWYLKAAIQSNKTAWGNIGFSFNNGEGVSVNKYKALEWYYKSGEYPEKVKELADKGIQLTEQDKNKSIEQLVMETKDIVWPGKEYK